MADEETRNEEQQPAEQAAPDAGAEAEEVLEAAESAVNDLRQESASGGEGDGRALNLPSLDDQDPGEPQGGLELLADVNLNVKVELGRTRMYVEDVLRLGEGSVVELDKLAGDPVDIYVNDCAVARGEVLVVNDNFCVRISEIISREPRELAEQVIPDDPGADAEAEDAA